MLSEESKRWTLCVKQVFRQLSDGFKVEVFLGGRTPTRFVGGRIPTTQRVGHRINDTFRIFATVSENNPVFIPGCTFGNRFYLPLVFSFGRASIFAISTSRFYCIEAELVPSPICICSADLVVMPVFISDTKFQRKMTRFF